MSLWGKSNKVAVKRGLQVVLCAAMFLTIMETPAQAQSLLTRHVRPAVTSGQAKFLYRLPETQALRIDVVLPLRDPAGLDKFLEEVYDPTSSTFRHFLTPPEFTARFGPSEEDYEAVLGYAKSFGLKVVGGSRDGMDVQLEGSVTSIEGAFNVSMGVYQHPTENRTFYAPDREPTVNLGFPLWHISGLDNYSIPHPALVRRNDLDVKSNATTGSGPSASFLGSDMRAAYYGGTALTGAGQNLGLFEYYGTDLADLNTYYKNVGQTNSVPITLFSTDKTSTSCTEPSCDDTEQTIDMTQALGMAPGLASLVMYIGSTDTAIISAMTTHSPLPTTIGCSWGWTPADPSTLNPYWEKMAAQGQNFFAASGDDSTWSSSNEAWPADAAYVVSVGGTDLTTASAGGAWASETAWSDSGGGISPDKIAIPSWQQLAGVINSSNKGSTTYRNGPDVSANANFTYYVCADQTTCTANDYGGTSFAAPLWAAYIALANQQAVANGQSTLGFINPTLYSIGVSSSYDTDFHDITSGKSGSYSAVTGYDLVTGWGSMNGAALINALAGPATPNFSISASPTSVTVIQGNSGTSTITTAALNGFDAAITLTATGQPSGVTVSFSGSGSIGAPGSGSATMTMQVASNQAAGTYPITVTGTSGSTVNTTTVTLTVTAPTFTVSASPTSVSVAQGSSGTSTITATFLNGFNSAVALTATGLPSGVTVGFSSTSITTSGGTSTMTLTVASTAATGTSTITVTGTGTGLNGTITQTATVSLTVTAPASANFSLSASPTSLTVSRGKSGTSTITSAIVGGFDSAVALSASGLPSGVTASFSPTSIAAPGSGTSTLTLTVGSRTRSRTSTITITGTGGGKTNTTTVSLTVSGGFGL
jgi:kumamolisin